MYIPVNKIFTTIISYSHILITYIGGELVCDIRSSFSLISSRNFGYSSNRFAKPVMIMHAYKLKLNQLMLPSISCHQVLYYNRCYWQPWHQKITVYTCVQISCMYILRHTPGTPNFDILKMLCGHFQQFIFSGY